MDDDGGRKGASLIFRCKVYLACPHMYYPFSHVRMGSEGSEIANDVMARQGFCLSTSFSAASSSPTSRHLTGARQIFLLTCHWHLEGLLALFSCCRSRSDSTGTHFFWPNLTKTLISQLSSSAPPLNRTAERKATCSQVGRHTGDTVAVPDWFRTPSEYHNDPNSTPNPTRNMSSSLAELFRHFPYVFS